MSDISYVDLMNFAVYGNDDPEWDDIKRYISSNPQAKAEYEEIKKNLPTNKKAGYSKSETIKKMGNDSEHTIGQSEDRESKKGWFGLF